MQYWEKSESAQKKRAHLGKFLSKKSLLIETVVRFLRDFFVRISHFARRVEPCYPGAPILEIKFLVLRICAPNTENAPGSAPGGALARTAG